MEEKKQPWRWQKITISLGSVALVLIGLIVVTYADLDEAQYSELVKGFGSFCSAVSTIALAAIIGNVGEHWKPAINTVLTKLGISKAEDPTK